MVIVGIIMAVILSIFSYVIIGPLGGVIILSILFGIVFDIYHRTKEIHSDVKRIKQHLGIANDEEIELLQIEEEIIDELDNIDSEELERVNEEIEKELNDLLDEEEHFSKDSSKRKDN
ncbi:hypothetical protein [Marinicrinis lubricantis]|uniref:Uncharacterized protein n=1 Tax=Marinicrinis lubricantis TaxID=2086470 RepID=A0ABW1IPF6_9BACL